MPLMSLCRLAVPYIPPGGASDLGKIQVLLHLAKFLLPFLAFLYPVSFIFVREYNDIDTIFTSNYTNKVYNAITQ